VQLNEIASGHEHNIETLRAVWKRTESGRTPENVVIDKEHEIEFYLATTLFSAQMRLGELKTKLDSVLVDARAMFKAELSAIEDELSVCTEGITLLLQDK
jgi:hypothetical protein